MQELFGTDLVATDLLHHQVFRGQQKRDEYFQLLFEIRLDFYSQKG